MNVVRHEIRKIKVRDFSMWEMSLHFASDVINKLVNHIPSEVCFSGITFIICSKILAPRGVECVFFGVTLHFPSGHSTLV